MGQRGLLEEEGRWSNDFKKRKKVTCSKGLMEMMVRYDRVDGGGAGGGERERGGFFAACQHASISELDGWKRQMCFRTLLPFESAPEVLYNRKGGKNHIYSLESRDLVK